MTLKLYTGPEPIDPTNRYSRINFRLTSAEREWCEEQAKAAGLKLSEWVRAEVTRGMRAEKRRAGK